MNRVYRVRLPAELTVCILLKYQAKGALDEKLPLIVTFHAVKTFVIQ